jgi:TrpR-related protein YerC/YecD
MYGVVIILSRKKGLEGTMQIEKLRGKELDQLFNAVLSLNDLEECYRFFDDLCTVNEIQSLAQRLEVARMLREGNTYHKIETQTGASTATISRVKRCLNYGNDAYEMALERVKKSQQSEQETEE